MEKQRIRSSNYTIFEKKLLLSLIDKNRELIDNKKTDTMNLKKKDETWERITELFNGQNVNGQYRSKKQLKKCYENQKKEMRKNCREGRVEEDCMDFLTEEIEIKNEDFNNVEWLEDGGEVNELPVPNEPDMQLITPDESTSRLQAEQNMINLKFTNDAKRINRKRPKYSSYLTKQYSQLVDLKLQLVKHQLQILKEDTERRREREEEEFQLKKTLLKLDIDIKTKQLQQL